MPELIEVTFVSSTPWWILLLVLIFPVVGVVVSILDYGDWNWFGASMFIAVLVGGIMALFLGFGEDSAKDIAVEDSLRESGFQEVDYSGDSNFDAVWGGERVKGLIVYNGKEDDTTSYQIVIIPPVAK